MLFAGAGFAWLVAQARLVRAFGHLVPLGDAAASRPRHPRRRTLELKPGLQASVLDMHMHSAVASSDSTLDPRLLPQLGPQAGLTGVNISEHDKMWDPHERDAYRAEHADFLVNFGMEVSTDLGHMLAIGLPSYISGIRRAERLREELDAVGGFLIVAHPFRHVFDEVTAMRKDGAPFVLSPAEAARLPVFQLVDAIEVANGCNTPRENYFAFEVARELGLPGTGGSDAHSESGIGYYATGFGRDLSDETELLEELHGGRFEAVLRAANGGFMRFEPGAVEAVGAAGS